MAWTPWKMYLLAWNLTGRCSSEFCEMAKKLTLNFKLNPRLKVENFSNFFFFDAKFESERIFHFRPCVYLAYLKSYGHLKILKCIGMY